MKNRKLVFLFYSYSFIFIMILRTIVVNLVINGQWVKLAHDDDGHAISFEEFKDELNSWFYFADILNIIVKNMTPFVIGLIFLYLFEFFGKESRDLLKGSISVPI